MLSRRILAGLAKPAAISGAWMTGFAALGAAPHAIGLIPAEPPPIVFDGAAPQAPRRSDYVAISPARAQPDPCRAKAANPAREAAQ